jgi:hypothetical protein
MNLKIQSDKLRRHQTFLELGDVERPLFGSYLFGLYTSTRYPRIAEALTPGKIKPEDVPIEEYLKDIDDLFELYTDLDDDFPFSSGAFYGIPWLEAIMGCEVYFSGTNFYTKPIIEDWQHYTWKKSHTQNNPWLEKMLECLDAVVQHSKGRFSCGPTRMRGIADMVSAMRGGTNLAFDSIDCPSNLEKLAEICTEVWIETGLVQLDLIPESENGYMVGASGLRVWFPEKGIWLQDDAVAVLSPNSYRRYFLPCVETILKAFSRVAIHLHGTVLWAVDIFLELGGIDVLELSYDLGLCELEVVKAAWEKIQAKKPCIAFGELSLEELRMLIGEMKPNGLSIQAVANNIEEARARRDMVFKGSAY